MNKFGIWSVLVLILAISMAAAVTALPISFDRVEVDGTDLSPMGPTRLDLERGQTVDVRMEISSAEDLSDVEITAFISGYEYNDFEKMSDTTHVFDMETGVTYVKNLKLTLPTKVDEDDYLLRIIATDRNGGETIQSYRLKLDVARHTLQITDVVFNPEDNVIAGRALLSTVRIKNAGEMDEESIKVTVAIPALAVSASDYIDLIEAGDSTTSEELYLRIPADAKPGIYDVLTTVKYDDGYEVVTQKGTIQVSAPVCTEDACKAAPEKTDKTVITISTDTQKVTSGEGGTVYPIALTNQGSATKTYVVKVDGTDGWATARISPSNVVVLAPGESSTVFIYLSATEKAAAGEHMFSVTISSADNVLKELPLKASVVSETAPSFGWEKIKTALEIGFVILVVILVVLGLIIGFSKLRDKEEPEEVSGQTYY
jgi:uncharacterized membrane protein